MYVELVQSNGDVIDVKDDKTLNTACYDMAGGSVRLMKKSLLRDDKLLDIALPYVNSVDVTIDVGKDASSNSFNLYDEFTSFVSSFV